MGSKGWVRPNSYGSLVTATSKSKRDPVYRTHKAYFDYGALHVPTWTERQQSIIAGEFDHKDVNKKEVEFILDKAMYLEINDLFDNVKLFNPAIANRSNPEGLQIICLVIY